MNINITNFKAKYSLEVLNLINSQDSELVEKNTNLSEQDIREGLEGNICRCTGYHNIVKSVQDAAQRMGG